MGVAIQVTNIKKAAEEHRQKLLASRPAANKRAAVAGMEVERKPMVKMDKLKVKKPKEPKMKGSGPMEVEGATAKGGSPKTSPKTSPKASPKMSAKPSPRLVPKASAAASPKPDLVKKKTRKEQRKERVRTMKLDRKDAAMARTGVGEIASEKRIKSIKIRR